MGVLFQFYLWDRSHVTIVLNTRETGDMCDAIEFVNDEVMQLASNFRWNCIRDDAVEILR